uniref:DUF4939 domain-containing protein n=1 Tax=Scophthalmus maximus TaxID=52904 RepID=A0A8D3D4L2_SCOMX
MQFVGPSSGARDRTILPLSLTPSDSSKEQHALRAQGQKLHQSEEVLSTMQQEMRSMAEASLTRFRLLVPRSGVVLLVSPVQSSVSSVALPHLSWPERFSGESGDCRAFLTQCGLHFELQAAYYPTDRARIAYLISHLTSRAEAWAMIFQHGWD